MAPTTGTDQPPPFVALADASVVRVRIPAGDAAPALHGLGFRLTAPETYERVVGSDPEKAALFVALRDSGFCFSRGREWSPADVVEQLRDLRLLTGTFRSIAWRGPSAWVVRDEPG